MLRLKACSIFLGYREFNASLKRENKRYILQVEEMGDLSPSEYIRHGFRIIKANRKEVEALVDGGYENRRILLRF